MSAKGIKPTASRGKIEAVVLDWAGTTLDYGSMAPVVAMQHAFTQLNLQPELDEIRAPMGLPKREHIQVMLHGERLARQFVDRFGRAWQDADVALLYQVFEKALFDVLPHHAKLLPGVRTTADWLQQHGIRIGSTTGYTGDMMQVLLPLACAQGYKPDCLVCPESVGGRGRPFPYMLWRNLETLAVSSIRAVIKVGDTAADIAEGRQAGCLSLGVVMGSSLLGLSQAETEADPAQLHRAAAETRQAFLRAGADHVLDSLADLPDFIESLERGEVHE